MYIIQYPGQVGLHTLEGEVRLHVGFGTLTHRVCVAAARSMTVVTTATGRGSASVVVLQ